ncbi:MAG: ECF transporter S component [Thermoleophilia bacterium]|nr:ECF transporter S component [Thermoleophilia bacterium]
MSAAAIVVLFGIAILLVGWASFERGPGGPKMIALTATLGAAIAAGRVLFVAIPSVKPVTTMCLVAGAALGARVGMAVGALAALISNAFLGQGPWTPAQMVLWGAVGASGALLRPATRTRSGLAIIAGIWGFVFGWAMNVWFLATFGPEVSWAAVITVSVASAWFDIAHSVGNVVFALLIGPALYRLLRRYAARVRMNTAGVPDPG